ncbi:PhnA domain-containing protein [Pontibacter ummariensis]|uniref:PhnA domain-containing protein n=1 Tax=Pontibacter ummariensis TaxID=1610492 RepID=UPI00358E237E
MISRYNKGKSISLTNGDHNIDCKMDGVGSVAHKSAFVRKASCICCPTPVYNSGWSGDGKACH